MNQFFQKVSYSFESKVVGESIKVLKKGLIKWSIYGRPGAWSM